MKHLLYLFALLWLSPGLQAQFNGGIGSGSMAIVLPNADPCGFFFGDSTGGAVAVLLPNPDACSYFLGDSTDGAATALLPNSDSCGFFEGSVEDGNAVGFLPNADSCGYFDGSVADGNGLVFFPSPVPCPTFYGSVADGVGFGELSCTPLVVNASPLQGRLEGPHGYLWWYTYHETQNLGFELQKSRNQVEWTPIGFLDGAGNSDREIKYSSWDRNLKEGVSYYRWMQIDYDGSVSHSNVVSLVKGGSPRPMLQVYPVPISAGEGLHLYFESPLDGPVRWQLVDLHGQIVLQDDLDYQGSPLDKIIPTTQLSQGTYLLVLDQLGERLTRRVIVY